MKMPDEQATPPEPDPHEHLTAATRPGASPPKSEALP
jgi:hypothetical protein